MSPQIKIMKIFTFKLKFLTLLLFGAMLAFVGCSDDDVETASDEEVAMLVEGETYYNEFLLDDLLQEQVEDLIVNYGSEDSPALFPISQSHLAYSTAGDESTAEELINRPEVDLYTAFTSITAEELESFIEVFAATKNLGDVTTDEDARMRAYIAFRSLLNEAQVDMALLIYLGNYNFDDTEAAVSLVEGFAQTRTSSSDSNALMREILTSGVTASQYVESDGACLSVASVSTKGGVLKDIKSFLKAIEFTLKAVLKIITSGAPDVDATNSYAAYLNADDTDNLSYYDPTLMYSGTYECRYGTSGAPLAQLKWEVECYYDAKHPDPALSGLYITKVGVIIEKIVCSGAMHVNSSVTFYEGSSYLNADGLSITQADAQVDVSYGDCCCFSRNGQLKFNIDAEKGYTQTYWNSEL